MAKLAKELDFEKEIVKHLVEENNYIERKSSQNPEKSNYDKTLAMDKELILKFLWDTQKDDMDALKRLYGTTLDDTIIHTIRNTIDQKQSSFIEVLRNGIDVSNHHLTLLYKKPATSLNKKIVDNYSKNIFSVIKEVWITDKSDKDGNDVPENVGRVDIVTFINGFPFAAFELKFNASGSTSQDAREQYERDRDPNNPLFRFKSGVVVCFAMDENEVYMTTHLENNKTQWMPFNMGRGEGIDCGSGNPIVNGLWPVHYMWDDILTKDSVVELLTKFVTVKREEKRDPFTDKVKLEEKMIFPRYHQRDCVQKILADVSKNGTECNYLIQHSAGSGKTNTIMWLAYRLASLHDLNDEPIFNIIVIVTDRIVVDRQLQAAINSFEHQSGYVKTIGEGMTSADLENALAGSTKIIVTTIQKFLYVYTEGMNDKRFAVLIDEAHQSTTGEDMKKLTQALSEEEFNPTDAVVDLVEETGKRSNISMFAFTATPKNKTLRLFGRLNDRGSYEAFHLYSMKQAIEEGFILDVLQNYIEYETYFEIAQISEDDPVLKKGNAKAQIALFASLNEENISQKVQIIVEHFRSYVMNQLGGNAKAMVVTSGRAEAVRYSLAMDAYLKERDIKDVKALVAFSGTVKLDKDGLPTKREGKEYSEIGMNGIPEKKLPDVFDGDEYNLLLVANKYQVGFDQPKLCAMYVLKTLQGVNAIQTLSRLNRTCKPYDKNVIVLDFVNTAAEMEKAFSKYYTTTLLTNTATETQLYELKDKIRGFYLYDDGDVDKIIEMLTKPEGISNLKRQSVINTTVNRIKQNLFMKTDEDQKEFKRVCKGYYSCYKYLSMLLPLNDESLKKEYLFLGELIQYLTTGTSGGIDIRDKVRLFNFKQENKGDKGIKNGHKSDPAISLPTVMVKLREDEEMKLSEILQEIEEKTGKQFSQESYRRLMEWFKALIASDPEIQDSAKANSFKDFMAFTYKDRTDNILVEHMADDYELMNALLKNENLCNQIFGTLAKGIYDVSRGADL